MGRSSVNRLPPASAQSLLKEKRDLPVLFISDFDEKFSNIYYHSVFDNSNNLRYILKQNLFQKIVNNLRGIMIFEGFRTIKTCTELANWNKLVSTE